jgi:epsilon-lactone hydrolase
LGAFDLARCRSETALRLASGLGGAQVSARMWVCAPEPRVTIGRRGDIVVDAKLREGQEPSATETAGRLDVRARGVPVPTTVSPEMRKLIGAPLRAGWDIKLKSIDEWMSFLDAAAASAIGRLPALAARLRVQWEKTTLDGVRAFHVTPDVVAPANRNRMLIHLHGGCYLLNRGEAGLPEAMLMASFGGFKVISIDYRMPPEAYFPRALDDAVTAWRAAARLTDPRKMAVFGTSAGGVLTLALILSAKQEGMPLPAAIASGTPMADVTKTGDTFYTNEMLDNVLVSRDGFCDAATRLYANGHDLADPLLSPVYGDLSGFPPTILTSGTRDLLLSNTVRVHRKLRQAGVEAALQVFEGQSHAQYMFDDTAPETKEAFVEIAMFCDRHLAK